MATLVVTEGPAIGERFTLPRDQVVSVGRDSECVFQVVDPYMSRKHMQVHYEPKVSRFIVRDYRSANGVMVNGCTLAEEAPLRSGDSIRIGHTTLVFVDRDFSDDEEALTHAKATQEWKRTTVIE